MNAAYRHPLPQVPKGVVIVAFPSPGVILLSMNRPQALNAMSHHLHNILNKLLDWFEAEPSLQVAVLASSNPRAWCVGMDLKELRSKGRLSRTVGGFGGLANRISKKPVIGAINGYVLGGGLEMMLNLDMVFAGTSSIFGLPEVSRGITVGAGGIPRLVRLIGRQKASELALTGYQISAQHAHRMGFINEVVSDSEVLTRAVQTASEIASHSPDSILALVKAIRLADEVASPSQAHLLAELSPEYKAVYEGDNLQEGLRAFAEKRKPKWKPSRL